MTEEYATRRERREAEAAAAALTQSLSTTSLPAVAAERSLDAVVVPVAPVVPAAPVVSSVPVATVTPVGLTMPVVTVVATPKAKPTTPVESQNRAVPVRRASRRRLPTKPAVTKRSLVSAVVMTFAAALIATMALPAYAFTTNGAFDPHEDATSLTAGQQSMASGAGTSLIISRDNYQAPSQAELKAKKAAEAAAAAAKLAATLQFSSTGAVTASAYPAVVSPEVQALASYLMAAVASGKLVGSRPDHIKEIGYLASGQAVPNCGVDFRVLQTIKVAVDNFDKVGVSDINRLCTGQLEGAGTISPHYRSGGGHAVDFYILNGHSLTGGDSDSMKLLRLLDPLVPANTNVGQAGCRASGSGFVNLSEFADSCSHLHVDFISARGGQLSGV
ncbi:hypothetical protein KPL76_00135 [Subtercola sp. PAMC28395]|uniref:hypothetical protein n=1 Tax=Subtercola sp. PAMC28395 TaxID=2846775 RepID=UPI001C0D6E7B|nr:hypothetical protein [Subtercola sp. PAMC28395]QWT23905.1 hypothetical protein KPL76_00135 [Subtercola sp. PAMC28395]